MPHKNYDEIPKFGFENKTFKNVKVIEIVDGDTLKCVIDVGGGVFGNKVWVPVRLVEIDAPEIKGETLIEKFCATLSMGVLAEKIFEAGKLDVLKKYIIDEIGKERINKLLSKDDLDESELGNEITSINKKFKEFLNEEINKSHFRPLALKTCGMDLYGRVLGKLYVVVENENVKEDDETNLVCCINSFMCEEGVARYFKGTKAREKWCFEDLKKMAERVVFSLSV